MADQFLPDIIAPGLTVIFCGINPGLHAAQAGRHFVGTSNRFWRVLHLSGFTPKQISAEEDHTILNYGYGLTTVVERATAGADELAKHEFLAAAAAFENKITQYAPAYVAFLGKAAYAALSGQRKIDWGPQSESFGGAKVWILPNPSGRNLAFRLDDLVRAYREFRETVEGEVDNGSK